MNVFALVRNEADPQQMTASFSIHLASVECHAINTIGAGQAITLLKVQLYEDAPHTYTLLLIDLANQ